MISLNFPEARLSNWEPFGFRTPPREQAQCRSHLDRYNDGVRRSHGRLGGNAASF